MAAYELASTKAVEEVFVSLLEREPHYYIDRTVSKTILGNPDVPLCVTALTNPHHGPCGRMHRKIENLLVDVGDRTCVQYILSAFNDELLVSNQFLTAVYLQYGEEKDRRIYEEWFTRGKYTVKDYIKKSNLDINSADASNKLEHHQRRKTGNHSSAIPTILVNGYKLLKRYQVEDLVHLVNSKFAELLLRQLPFDSKGMKYVFLLLCDLKIEDLNRWIAFVTGHNFLIYIHLDTSLKRQKNKILHSEQALGVYNMFNVHSKETGELDAILYLLNMASTHNSYDYIHTLDAKDFPLKGLEKLNQFCCICSEHESMGVRPLSKLNYPLYYEGKYQMSITGRYADFPISSRSLGYSLHSQITHFLYPGTIFLPMFVMRSSYSSKAGSITLLFEENDGKDWWKIATSSASFLRGVSDVNTDTLWQQIQYYLLAEPSLPISPPGCQQTSGFYGHHYDAGLGNALLDIFRLSNIDSIGDFGRGPGQYAALLYRNGYTADGYDDNPHVEEMSTLLFEDGSYCQCADLSEEVRTEEPFDAVSSLEVGEHIPADREDVFFLNLIRNARKYIALGWAAEGQCGDGHVNCRFNYYIISRMEKHGFYENRIVSQYLRSHATYWWFKNATMFFEKQNMA